MTIIPLFNMSDFKEGLLLIENATKNVAEDDLRDLNERGYIPTGIMNYLIVCRVSVGKCG